MRQIKVQFVEYLCGDLNSGCQGRIGFRPRWSGKQSKFQCTKGAQKHKYSRDFGNGASSVLYPESSSKLPNRRKQKAKQGTHTDVCTEVSQAGFLCRNPHIALRRMSQNYAIYKNLRHELISRAIVFRGRNGDDQSIRPMGISQKVAHRVLKRQTDRSKHFANNILRFLHPRKSSHRGKECFFTHLRQSWAGGDLVRTKSFLPDDIGVSILINEELPGAMSYCYSNLMPVGGKSGERFLLLKSQRLCKTSLHLIYYQRIMCDICESLLLTRTSRNRPKSEVAEILQIFKTERISQQQTVVFYKFMILFKSL